MSNTIHFQSDAANDLTDDTFTFETEHIGDIWKIKMVTLHSQELLQLINLVKDTFVTFGLFIAVIRI